MPQVRTTTQLLWLVMFVELGRPFEPGTPNIYYGCIISTYPRFCCIRGGEGSSTAPVDLYILNFLSGPRVQKLLIAWLFLTRVVDRVCRPLDTTRMSSTRNYVQELPCIMIDKLFP
jgi:hypothetical protein